MLTGKRILITGPTGQVARPLVAALAPGNEVFTLARFSKAEDRAAIEALGAHTIATDLADGPLDQVPQDLDYVLNLAVVKSGDFDYDLRANAGGVGRLKLRTRGEKGYLHFSSAQKLKTAFGIVCVESALSRWSLAELSIQDLVDAVQPLIGTVPKIKQPFCAPLFPPDRGQRGEVIIKNNWIT
jgi:NAD(P)-dependent dehydrogenase (short-subunit alcohol dehydrogenase family)